MSGVVTPPPRPPRPYLPAQDRKDGSKSAAKMEDRVNKEPSPGHGRSTGKQLVGYKIKARVQCLPFTSADTASVPQRSYTFSSGGDIPPRPQRPVRKQRAGSEASSGRESLSPERPISPSSKLQPEKRTNIRSPLRKSQSQGMDYSFYQQF